MFKDKYGQKLPLGIAFGKITNRLFNYYLDFLLMLTRWVGNIPSHMARKAFYKAFGVKIGKGSTIHMWANFFNPSGVTIGSDTLVGDHVFLDGRDRIKIGSHTDIASQVMVFNSQHKLNDPKFEAENAPVEIGDYCFVGPRVIILPGVTIGKGAVVAAGAVVTKNVKPFEIVGGVPAVKIGERKNKNPNYILGRARLFQ